MSYLFCKNCGLVLGDPDDRAVNVTCCGEKMQTLVANTTDASAEKHVPAVTVDGNIVTVSVGSVAHPMTDEHFIAWVSIVTNEGNHRKPLKPGDAPVAKFALTDGEKVLGAFAYCNLHSLWKKDI